MLTPREKLHNLACALYVEAHPEKFPRARGIGAEIERLSREVLELSDNDLLLGMDLLTGKIGYDRERKAFTREPGIR